MHLMEKIMSKIQSSGTFFYKKLEGVTVVVFCANASFALLKSDRVERNP